MDSYRKACMSAAEMRKKEREERKANTPEKRKKLREEERAKKRQARSKEARKAAREDAKKKRREARKGNKGAKGDKGKKLTPAERKALRQSQHAERILKGRCGKRGKQGPNAK